MMDKKLRIAMLGHKRIPSHEGGVEVVVEELSVRMAQQGYSVTCYNRSGHHVSGKKFDGDKVSQYKDVKIKYVPTLQGKGLAAFTSSIFSACCSAFGRYDIVHFHAEGACIMLWLPKLCGKRCYVTIHGIDWKREKWGRFASRYIKFCEKVAVRFADEIIVLSRNAQKYFSDTYGRKTVVIPNGADRPEIRKADLIRTSYGLEKDGYILFLGRLVPEKGISYLIEAFQKIQTDKKLVIVGGASDTEDYVEKLKNEAGDDRKILFTGFVQGRMVEELYSNAYVYCLPSNLEGMPLCLLEAMSYGNCCIVSDIAECVEVVEDKAVLFEKGNVEDLAEKLQMLCSDKRMVDAYREGVADYICSKYNWDDVAEKTMKLYRRD